MSGRRPVHLVGSVPLADTAAVLTTVAAALGPHLKRAPDGETGLRRDWIQWQYPRLAAHPDVEADPAIPPRVVPSSTGQGAFRVLRTRRPGPLDARGFAPGYAEAARESYAEFARLKARGVLPAALRFQVSLPTPYAVTHAHFSADSFPAAWLAYERAILAELDVLQDWIPADALAVQWDTCLEVLTREGVLPGPGEDPETALLEALARLGAAVRPGVELGYHLCYGDLGHRHFVEPRDATVLTRLANDLVAAVPRPIDFLHLPVPRDRTDAAYFAPLRALALPRATELYLGLVHHTDGVAGTRARMQQADRRVARYGLSTECGWGRRDPGTIPALLAIHRECAAGESA